MKKIFLILSGLSLLGMGCQQSSNTSRTLETVVTTTSSTEIISEQQANADLITYTNTIGKYSFLYNYVYGLVVTTKIGGEATSTDREVYIAHTNPEGEGAPLSEDMIFKVEPTTVYPEHRIEQLKAEYLSTGVKKELVTTPITLGGRSGWEIKTQNFNTADNPIYSRIIYFPLGENELVIFEPGRNYDYDPVIASLKFIK